MRRREFVRLLGGLGGSIGAWPLAVRAQKVAMPVVGFLSSASPQLYSIRLRAFRQGLKETGYIEGQNVAVEYRWAEDQNSRLSALAADLVQRQVNVIVAGGGTPTAAAARDATSATPIVFELGADPVKTGFVASLDRPGGNLTGLANLNVEVGPKRLELIRELLPSASVIGVLVNSANPTLSETAQPDLQAAARKLCLELHFLNATTDRDFEKVFAELIQLKANALVINPDVLFSSHVERLANLAVRHTMPTIYQYRPFVEAGGLLSYGSDETDIYHRVGVYAGRILRGEKPADLPVQQSTKVELLVNLKTAKALGIAMPSALLARADQIIE